MGSVKFVAKNKWTDKFCDVLISDSTEDEDPIASKNDAEWTIYDKKEAIDVLQEEIDKTQKHLNTLIQLKAEIIIQ